MTTSALPSDGFIVLDKPSGISSAQAVAQVKRLLKCKKIGHGGTLDPLASGILPLAIGEATKAFDYVASTRKEYRFTVTFGEERDTDDSEGLVTRTTERLPDAGELQAALAAFRGMIQQVPPVYSALHVNGQRAYARARAGEAVELAARPVEIYALELAEALPPGPVGAATLEVACGKGTYVRSLARDIAIKCNSLGYVSMLRRTRVGKFREAQAISLDQLAEFVHNSASFEAWVPIELALDDIPAIDLNAEEARRLRHGQTIGTDSPDGRYMALHQGRIVALAESEHGILRTMRVFHCS